MGKAAALFELPSPAERSASGQVEPEGEGLASVSRLSGVESRMSLRGCAAYRFPKHTVCVLTPRFHACTVAALHSY